MIVAVVVTYDRPALLRGCLRALHEQRQQPDEIIVVDDASPGAATAAVIAEFERVTHLRHVVNHGGAAAYRTGIEFALAAGADFVWLMDDDAHPSADSCLERLVALAQSGVGIAAPLVLDGADQNRLAFPIRQAGRTRFLTRDVQRWDVIESFAHLFNGALVSADAFLKIGLPDPRFVGRGDEVDFLLRAQRAGIRIRLDTEACFMHPSSGPEIHPILFGLFYATVPVSEAKRQLQFRNRGYIFRHHGMWLFLIADIARYACYYLLRWRPDPTGMWRWLRATAAGWRGDFMRTPPTARRCILVSAHSAEFAHPMGTRGPGWQTTDESRMWPTDVDAVPAGRQEADDRRLPQLVTRTAMAGPNA